MPDGRLPCEECGEKPMRPVSEIDKVDYEQLLKKVSQVGRHFGFPCALLRLTLTTVVAVAGGR